MKTRIEYEDYEFSKTMDFTASKGAIDLNQKTLPADIIKSYIMHHIFHNWTHLLDRIMSLKFPEKNSSISNDTENGFGHNASKSKSNGQKKRQKKSNGQKKKQKSNNNSKSNNRVGMFQMHIATSAIYNPVYRRAMKPIKFWTFWLVRLERDPDCIYIFASDKDEGIWMKLRKTVDAYGFHGLNRPGKSNNPSHRQTSPFINTVEFKACNRLYWNSNYNNPLKDDPRKNPYKLDVRTISADWIGGKELKYFFIRWEDGEIYDKRPLREFYHKPIFHASIFNIEFRDCVKKHICENWKLVLISFYKQIKHQQKRIQQQEEIVIQKLRSSRIKKDRQIADQIKSEDTYFAMHIATIPDESFPFVNPDLVFITMVFYAVMKPGLEKTLFWHVSFSPRGVDREVKNILGDYTCTPYNILHGDKYLPNTDFYTVCNYSPSTPTTRYDFRDWTTGEYYDRGDLEYYKNFYLKGVYRSREIDKEISDLQERIAAKEKIAARQEQRNLKIPANNPDDIINPDITNLIKEQVKSELKDEEYRETKVNVMKEQIQQYYNTPPGLKIIAM